MPTGPAAFAYPAAHCRRVKRTEIPGLTPQRWPVAALLRPAVISLKYGGTEPRGYSGWEIKQLEKLNRQWAEARLNGLSGDDATIIEWIRLSKGEQPHLAADLSRASITPAEAGLRLGYAGRLDPRRETLFQRFRNRQINQSEAIAAVGQWRKNSAAS